MPPLLLPPSPLSKQFNSLNLLQFKLPPKFRPLSPNKLQLPQSKLLRPLKPPLMLVLTLSWTLALHRSKISSVVVS